MPDGRRRVKAVWPSPTMLAAVVIVIVIDSAVAAPQSADDQIISIAGQPCKCVNFYMCEKSNYINIPEGSTETGCSDGLTCCRTEDGAPPPVSEPISVNPVITESYVTSSELPPVTHHEEPNVEKPNKCICVSKTQCLNHDTNDDNPNIDIRFGCSSNQVCCDKKYIKTQNTHEPDPNEDKTHNGHYNDRSCGVGMPPRDTENTAFDTRIVVNSQEKSVSYFGQFPWMVAILKIFIDETTHKRLENVFQCGGSLIHPQIVLTAAHCVNGIDINLLKVRVGEWDTQSNDNDEESKDSHQDIGVSKIIVHQHHNNASMFNDVALIKLNYPYEEKPHINTICIPNNEKEVTYDPHSCVSIGWGKDGFKKHHQYQDILKKVDLSLVPNDVCQNQLRKTRLGIIFRLHESFICAGGEKGVDTCQGDGGGPLFCAIKGERKKYMQVGIVSWGIGCGTEGVPGVYASLMYNLKWINEHLQKLTK